MKRGCKKLLVEQAVECRTKKRRLYGRTLLKVVTVVSSCIVGLTLFVGSARLVLGSGIFRISEIEVKGDFKRVLPSDVITASGVKNGDNLFTADVNLARGRVAALSWVKSVSVRRLPPSTIMFEIEEHSPAAIAIIDGVPWFIDAKGKLIKEREAGEAASLLVVSGECASDAVTRVGAMKMAGELEKVVGVTVSDIRCYAGEGYSAILDGGVEFVLGSSPNWESIATIWKYVQARNKGLKYILADEQDRLVAGYSSASAANADEGDF